jgi:hypothetical protein
VVDEGADQSVAALEQRLSSQDASHPGYAAAWREFSAVVLSHGGRYVAPPSTPDVMIGMLGEQGRLVPSSTVVARRAGDPQKCHQNAVALWRDGHATAIGTGYALSPDSFWREHSWAWTRSGHLIKTGEPRVAYIGLRMESDFADWFADWISPNDAAP